MILHAIIKIVTGMFVVPLGIALSIVWPWWTTQKSLSIRILAGIIILPWAAVTYVVVNWWEGF